MKHTVIVVAGGKGLRMGGGLPKQFIPIQGKPVLMHTLEAFYKWNSAAELLLVIPEEHEYYWNMLCKEINFTVPHCVVYGGETRFHSVRNGLREVKDDCLVAVHDGVRPFVTADVITSCFKKAEVSGAAIPVVPMVESARIIIRSESDNKNPGINSVIEVENADSSPLSRKHLFIVQTPQVFQSELLHKAYKQPYDERFTDDASLVEALGHKIHLVNGNRENIKITTPIDLQYAEFQLKNDS